MNIKILDKYIFKELAKVFVISVSSLTMVLYLDKFLFMAEMIVSRGVTFFEMGRIMFFISPSFLALTVPMSVLVASVVTFNQFCAHNEWTAMKTCHLSFMQSMRPVIAFSILSYFLASIIMLYALPWGNLSYKEIIYDIIKNRASIDIKPNVFNYDFKNIVLLARNQEEQFRLTKIFVADSTQSKTPVIITAKEGLIIPNPKSMKIQLKLKNGVIHQLSSTRSGYQKINFDTYELNLRLPDTKHLEKEAIRGNRELSIAQLLKQIDAFEAKGLPTSGVKVELSKKFSIPFTCLLFGILGAPLGIHSSRSGKSGSFAMCIFVILTYYIGLIFMQNMGRVGEVQPYLSVWMPNIVLLGIIIYTSYKMQKDLPFKLTTWIADRGILSLEYCKNFYYKFVPLSHNQEIKPLIYGRNRKSLDETAKKIMREKIQKIKYN